ncbi:MAG: DegT/DnrJ/EryC1/StrS family aminotransferase [Gaiellaceae bacterium]
MSTSTTPSQTREIPFARPWIEESDRRAVDAVLRGHILTHGPEGEAFGREFGAFMGGDSHCLPVSSCMAALHLACLHFGFGAGDEVLVAAETHVATAHAVEWVGARPVFVDPELATGNVTADGLRAAITERTRGVILVHYLGIPCDMPAIMEVAREYSLVVIEDCALAVGSRVDGGHVGLFGDAGCYSFYPVKHITTAEGGMFVTRHDDVAAGVSRLRAFGVDRTHSERTVPGMYDVPQLGLNYRMSEPQAALGRVQLTRIDENLARRAENFSRIADAVVALDGVSVLDAQSDRFANSHYCLGLRLDSTLAGARTLLVNELAACGVGTSVYYPQPVPRMRYYAEKYGYDASAFPNATAISDGAIALPVGPHLSPGDAAYVGAAIADAVRRIGR